jgi:hypothetical protein
MKNKVGSMTRDSEACLQDLFDTVESGATDRLLTQRYYYNLTDGD